MCVGEMGMRLQALVLEAEEKLEAQQGGDRASLAAAAATFYEVTIASIDQPKLLSRLSESLVCSRAAVQRQWPGGLDWAGAVHYRHPMLATLPALCEHFHSLPACLPAWLQGDLGLNICEAHAFNTKDRFSLDVFVVNGWAGGGSEELEDVLSRRLQELPPPVVRGTSASPPASTREMELRGLPTENRIMMEMEQLPIASSMLEHSMKLS